MKIKIKKALVGLILMGLSSSVQAVEKTGTYGTASQDRQCAVDMLREEVSNLLIGFIQKKESLYLIIRNLIKKNPTIDARLKFLNGVMEREAEVREQLIRLLPVESAELTTQAVMREEERISKLPSMNQGNEWELTVLNACLPTVLTRSLKERMNQEFNPRHVRQLLGMLGLSGWHQLDFLPEVINPMIEIVDKKNNAEGEILNEMTCIIHKLEDYRGGICNGISSLPKGEFAKGMIEYFWDNNSASILEWLDVRDGWQSVDKRSDFFYQDKAPVVWIPKGEFGPIFPVDPHSLGLMKEYFLDKFFEGSKNLDFYIQMFSPTYRGHTTRVTTTPHGVTLIDCHADSAPRIMKNADKLLEALIASVFGDHLYISNRKIVDQALLWFFPKNETCNQYEYQIMVECVAREIHDKKYYTLSPDKRTAIDAKYYPKTIDGQDRFYSAFHEKACDKYNNNY